MARRVGTGEEAVAAWLAHHEWMWQARLGDSDGQFTLVGRGEDRSVYRCGDVVYKVGSRPSANPYDHEVQEAARAAGCRWAPPASSLYRLAVPGGVDSVLAMPYIVDDGTRVDPELLAEMNAQTGGGVDALADNYMVVGGQPIVVDGCTVDLAYLPPAGGAR
jgi:hypothetical protein